MSLALEIFEGDAARHLALAFAPVLQGQPGPAGGSTFARVAGEVLPAPTVVWEDEAGAVWPLDAQDAAHIDCLCGVAATGAANTGAMVSVQRGGILDVSGLGFAPGRVWLGAAGALTQTPPETGYNVLMGYATSASRLYLSISEPINLDD